MLDRKTGDLEKLPSGDYYFNDVLFSSDAKSLYAIAYGPTTPVAIVKVDLASKSISHIRVPAKLPCSAGYLTKPELIEFPTMNGSAKAYGYYYSPKVFNPYV